MIKELVASVLLSGSIGAKSVCPVIVPVNDLTSRASYNGSTYSIYGNYNFRDTWDFSVLSPDNYSFTVVFETMGEGTDESPLYTKKTPFSLNDNSYQQLYLLDMQIDIYFASYDTFIDCDIAFNCYDLYANTSTISFTIERGDDLTDFSYYGALMFNVRESILLQGVEASIFDVLFTPYDNAYTYTYSGYYSFINSISSIPSKICVFGSTLFDTNIGYGFTNYGYPDTSIGFYRYNLLDGVYFLDTYTLPFDNNYVTSKNMIMTSCKMSLNTKSYLESVGIFGYVRDNSFDNANFKDLLFGIVDTPIYFVSSILSFELFGVNLFVALTGLLTICCILLLIKKFW